MLLHPEGAPSWHGDRVGPLVPRAAAMAGEASRADASRPVFIIPVVWKLHFTGDVSRSLEQKIAHVERRLELGRAGRGPLELRFAALHKAVLARSVTRHGAKKP